MKSPNYRSQRIFSILLTIMLFSNLGCKNNDNSTSEESTTSTGQTTSPANNQDRGNFILRFDMDDEMSPIYKARLMLGGELKRLVDELNEGLALPHDLIITFKNYGEPNAEYRPDTKSITFGYEFVHLFDSMFLKEYGIARRDDATRKTVIFFLLHELGHALIDIYKVPLNGNTEDIADNFSVFVVSGGEEIATTAMEGANFFAILSRSDLQTRLGHLAVFDEHLLNPQRLYNIACKLYGSDPEKYTYLVNGYLPESKTGRCAAEYESMKKAWIRDLGPWSKYR